MLKRLVPAFAALAVAAPALAADLPSVKDAPLPAPVVFPYDWTGVYVGADLGGAWAEGKYTVGAFSNTQYGSSILGGGFVGFNRQLGSFVLGIEGDFQGLGVSKSGPVFGYTQNFLGAVNGRLGFAFNHFLVYAIGGVAFSDTKLTNFGGSYTNGENVGYDVGGGLEYAFLPNWTARGEYRYYNFGSFNGTYGARPVYFNFQKSDNTFRVGVAYKFGPPAPAPVVAKY